MTPSELHTLVQGVQEYLDSIGVPSTISERGLQMRPAWGFSFPKSPKLRVTLRFKQGVVRGSMWVDDIDAADRQGLSYSHIKDIADDAATLKDAHYVCAAIERSVNYSTGREVNWA